MSTHNASIASQRREELVQELIRLGEISSTETALFQQRAAAILGLGVTDLKALSALLQEGPMAAGQLTRRLGLTTGAGTILLDRLERAEYIERQPHASDRRKVMVAINRAKLPTTNTVYDSMATAFAALLAAYSADELALLVRFHQAVIAMTRGEIERLATTKRPTQE